MSRKIIYADISGYNKYKDKLILGKEDFTVIKTLYTKKIILPYRTIIFNKGGIDDFNVLSLINKVRSDAKKYVFRPDAMDNYVRYYKLFFDPVDFVCVKIDLSSAYWTAAINKGIISKETSDFFDRLYEDKNQSSAKQARLKALGSLATTKIKEIYIKGKLDEDLIAPEIQSTKPLYMAINKEVDNIMMEAAHEFNRSVYYYWDCIFIANEQSKDFLQYIDDKGYKAKKTGETLLKVKTINEKKYLISIADNKSYMIRPEEEYLVNSKIKSVQYDQEFPKDRPIW